MGPIGTKEELKLAAAAESIIHLWASGARRVELKVVHLWVSS